MAQHQFTNGAFNHQAQASWRRVILLPGISVFSGITLLTGQPGLAQTSTEPAPVQSIPPVQTDVAPIPAPAPIPAESFPVEFSAPPAAPEPQLQPVAPIAPPTSAVPSNDGYIAPGTIIFSERSTGCQATVKAGQTPGSVCGDAGLSQVNVPGWRGSNGQAAGSVTAAGIGSLSVVAPSAQIGSTPSLKDFYRRTMRPPARLGNGNVRLMFPLAIPAPISSLFGWRIHPITGDVRFHSGTDLAAPLGTPVLAAYAGQVVLADFLGGYGLAVAIDHTKGTQQSLYAHLSEVFVKPGDEVKQGEVIGRVGSTGNSTGPHLHFEFRQLTSEGWVALDAGEQLEYALAQLVNSLEIAQASSPPTKANAGVQGVVIQ